MTPPPTPFSQVAGELLSARLRAVVETLAAAATFDPHDAEPVHRLRVAARRAVAALDFFRPLLPRSIRETRAALRRVRHAADVARDCDVLAGRLASDDGSEANVRALAHCAAARREAQTPIVREHEALARDNHFMDEIVSLSGTIRAPCVGKLSEDVVARRWIARRIRRSARRFRQASRPRRWTADSLHSFRIAGKKLRYALELAAALETALESTPGIPMSTPHAATFDALSRKASRRASRLANALDFLEALQDRLGELNDFAAGARLLTAWLEGSLDDDDERQEIRGLRREERRSFRQASRRFVRWWTAPRRRRVIRRLKRLSS